MPPRRSGQPDISGRDFWVYGAILGAVLFAALLLLGVPWRRMLGL